jgi:hypothetical protein
MVPLVFVLGCSKSEVKPNPPLPMSGAAAASVAKDCGTDYADPLKEFCVTIPTGYTVGHFAKPDDLYSEQINFNGPDSGFSISVGFSSTNWTSYEDELKANEARVAAPDIKVESSGLTGGTGKWWVTTRTGGNRNIWAVAKSNGNRSISCSANNTFVAPAVIEACKSIRAYPN